MNITGATGCLLTIFAFFTQVKLLHLQSLSKKFYNRIVPQLMFRCPTFKSIEKVRNIALSDYASEKLIQNIASFDNLNFLDMKIDPVT